MSVLPGLRWGLVVAAFTRSWKFRPIPVSVEFGFYFIFFL